MPVVIVCSPPFQTPTRNVMYVADCSGTGGDLDAVPDVKVWLRLRRSSCCPLRDVAVVARDPLDLPPAVGWVAGAVHPVDH